MTSKIYETIRLPLFLSVAALWVLLIVCEAVEPCFFLHDDSATSFIGMYVHDFRVLTKTGRVAEVNYYQYGGEPFLEQGQTAVLYPPIYLGVALAKWASGDVRWTIEWLAAGHLTLGLLGFYFWLRQGGVTPWIAALSGLAWVLCPFILIFGSSWIMTTYAAAWLPWLFWALDRLFARPTMLSAFFLGTFLGLFFLQGYVQWVVYSVLFLGLYALLRLYERGDLQRGKILFHLVVAALVFLIFALPLMMPMFHAMNASAARGEKISLLQALYYHVELRDLLPAQIGIFRPHLIFGGSTAILCCPALLLLPLMIWRFFKSGPEIQRRLFSLVLLGLIALVFSTRWHIVLTLLPVMDKFRWPLKVFVFVDFFLIAALAWSVTTWSAQRLATACVAFVLLAGATVSLACHDSNFFSKASLPTSRNPLAPGMDPARGRVIAIANIPPEADSYRFYTYGHGTFFAVPCLGGYDPLLSRDRLDFALGLDFPNVFRGQIDSTVRAKLDALAVRYWIVDTDASQLDGIEALPGIKQLPSEPDRFVFENLQAAPLIYSDSSPQTPCAFAYSGNSILIPVEHTASPVEVSVGPTDGWWYRIDGGNWQKALYENDRLKIDFEPENRILEVTFFDARFYHGLYLSLYLIIVVVLITLASRFFKLEEPIP